MNGVPLRRVAQAYVIATQTKMDIDGVNLPESLNDDYFRRSGAKSSGEGIFADAKIVSIVKKWFHLFNIINPFFCTCM